METVELKRWVTNDDTGVSIWEHEPHMTHDEDGDNLTFEHEDENAIMEDLDSGEFEEAFGFCPEFDACRAFTVTKKSSVTVG
ncbi:hypothetical protein LCGC14_1795600 [marine sediment metagenome]|uniref:Uncharacterized protein n=1 Tax=marine sediment metagenome TaxID=412755 RepID=A0A0F9J615_9ZZZZ